MSLGSSVIPSILGCVVMGSVVLCCLSEVLVVCCSVHVVLSVLRSRSLSFVHLSTSCR